MHVYFKNRHRCYRLLIKRTRFLIVGCSCCCWLVLIVIKLVNYTYKNIFSFICAP